MKLKNIILFIGLLLFISCASQKNSTQINNVSDCIFKENDMCNDNILSRDWVGHRDVIYFNSEAIVIPVSPFSCFKGNRKLLDAKDGFVEGTTNAGLKGYICEFKIINGNLFLVSIHQDKNAPFVKTANKTLREKIEQLTDRKFNISGKMKVVWLSGMLYGRVNGEMGDEASPHTYKNGVGKDYKLSFQKGKLIDIVEIPMKINNLAQ